MSRRNIASNSFQEEVINFLLENPSYSYTAKEILEGVNKKSGKQRTPGSMSGTLKVLCDDAWIRKTDDYPARYSYQPELAYTQASAKELNLDLQLVSEDVDQKNFLVKKLDSIRREMLSLDEKIERLQRDKAVLQGKLELAEELLSQRTEYIRSPQ